MTKTIAYNQMVAYLRNIEDAVEEENRRLERTLQALEAYVKDVIAKKHIGAEVGLVYTKASEDIAKGRFMIYISRSNGLYISHKYYDVPDYIMVIFRNSFTPILSR